MVTWNKKLNTLALMTGHGKSIDGTWDPGCTYGAYTEAALCQDITKTAVKYLRQSGIDVISDSDYKNNKNMVACVKWANDKFARLYMSVHCDYSGASTGVYPLYVSADGKKMAKSVGKSVAKQMGMKFKGAAKRTDLYELNATDMPAVIFECGAIKADLAALKQHKKYGKALAKAICSYLNVKFVDSTGIVLPPRGYFKEGDIGENVKTLQKFLKNQGYMGDIDGIYGKLTVSAVKNFQKKNGLEADGLFGPESLKVADKSYK